MEELFDLAKFDSYKEDNRREVKKAEGGRTRAILSEMDDVEALGTNRTRRYQLRAKRE